MTPVIARSLTPPVFTSASPIRKGETPFFCKIQRIKLIIAIYSWKLLEIHSWGKRRYLDSCLETRGAWRSLDSSISVSKKDHSSLDLKQKHWEIQNLSYVPFKLKTKKNLACLFRVSLSFRLVPVRPRREFNSSQNWGRQKWSAVNPLGEKFKASAKFKLLLRDGGMFSRAWGWS